MENNFCSLKTSYDLARVTDERQLGNEIFNELTINQNMVGSLFKSIKI
jgi:hypothetical protein